MNIFRENIDTEKYIVVTYFFDVYLFFPFVMNRKKQEFSLSRFFLMDHYVANF